MAKRDEYELSHLGGYERIYPPKGTIKKYEAFIKTATDLWDSYTVLKKKLASLTNKEKPKKIVKQKRRVHTHNCKVRIPFYRINKRQNEKNKSIINKCDPPNLPVTQSFDSAKYNIPRTSSVNYAMAEAAAELCEENENSDLFVMPVINKREQTYYNQEFKDPPIKAQSKIFGISKKEVDLKNTGTKYYPSEVGRFMNPMFGQGNGYGIYIMPKVVDLAMMDSIKMPNITQKKWIPSKIYKPSIRYIKDGF